jgi:hypothetical protein
MSRRDQETLRLGDLATACGYTGFHADCDERAIGSKAERWTVRVDAPYQGRIEIARGTSWAKCYAAAMAYLTN